MKSLQHVCDKASIPRRAGSSSMAGRVAGKSAPSKAGRKIVSLRSAALGPVAAAVLPARPQRREWLSGARVLRDVLHHPLGKPPRQRHCAPRLPRLWGPRNHCPPFRSLVRATSTEHFTPARKRGHRPPSPRLRSHRTAARHVAGRRSKPRPTDYQEAARGGR
jgi:hypothetical protein